MPFSSFAKDSICYGETKKGKLENGVKLPLSGENFSSYSNTLWLFGRTYVHSAVKEILLDSYSKLNKEFPKKKFMYAETGLKNGGLFKPHKTHQNGLSVDLMVPILENNKKSVFMPTSVFNKWGYGIHFNKRGIYKNYSIDFDALGELIKAIHQAAKQSNVKIWRVIFAPDLQPALYRSSQGEYIKKHITVPKKRSWVRHDEHIHIDFQVPCKRLE